MKLFSIPTMRRMLLPVLGLMVMVSSTSCIEILERISLKKDGSGEYLVRMDMSQMMSMIMAFSNISDSTETEVSASEDYNMDSVIRFADMPDSIKRQWKYPEVTKNGTVWLTMNEDLQHMEFTIGLPFNSLSEVNKFSMDMSTGLSAFDTPLGSGDAESNDLFLGAAEDQFAFKPGQLTRKASKNEAGTEDLDEEEMEMMKMMMGTASYKVEYVLPGKVKKVSGLNYSISEDGSTVTRSFDFIEILDGKADMGVEVSYK